MANHELEPWELPGAPSENRTRADHESKIATAKEPRKTGKSDHIRRAERKEEEARHLLREAKYLRDLDRRLSQ